ncbi:MAG: threonine synthase [Candidatus Glassbacteria bacterium]|nr:threonine synthase [Candidatus Glassbacteria bacterium]
MNFNCRFQCINPACRRQYAISEVIYNCESCGSLLEVAHDLEALRTRDARQWKDLFDKRYKSAEWPYGSAVWGKKEWVCPAVDDNNVVSMYEGGTNLFWAERFGKMIGVEDIWIKQCGNSHTGSFKDLGMTVLVSMVKQMICDGADIRAVACASTGDTSAALASYCACAGIPSVVFLPKGKVSTAQLIQPIANGAITLCLDTDFDGCMAIVKKITEKKQIYLANSMNSLRIEGQKTVSVEVVQQFEWNVPDIVVIPGGNLGNVSALGKGFLMMYELGLVDRLPRIVCAQAAKANPLYLSYLNGFEHFEPVAAGKTLASAIQIGNPVSINKAIDTLKRFDGVVEQASEQELADAAALADMTGLFNCPHTGVALAVTLKLVSRGIIKPEHRVVVVSTAHGLKFTGFKTGYHQGALAEVESNYVNQPLELAADTDLVRKAIDDQIARRRAVEVDWQMWREHRD